jgi:hypothetical protein
MRFETRNPTIKLLETYAFDCMATGMQAYRWCRIIAPCIINFNTTRR